MPRTGFLPEPVPAVEVPESKVQQLVQDIREYAKRMPNVSSPLFSALKETAFRRMCEGLSVEQAMARYATIFENGIADSDIELSMNDIKKYAQEIGEECTDGVVVDALSDPRLFRDWIHAVVQKLAERHFTSGSLVHTFIDVMHVDLPNEAPDRAYLVILVDNIYDEEDESYHNSHIRLTPNWPGRHAVKEAWVEYIVYLMRLICGLSV